MMRIPLPRTIAGLVLLLGSAACSDTATDESASVIRADSAGVEVVESPLVADVFAVLDTVPKWSLGGVDVVGPTQFSQVDNIHVQQNGDIWVADRQSRRIEVFAEDGSHKFGVGGRGDGPTEFQRLRLLGGDSTGNVFAMDAGTGKLLIHSPSGAVVRSASWAQPNGRVPPTIEGVTSSGSVISWKTELINTSELEPGDIYGDSVTYLMWTEEGTDPQPVHTAPRQGVVYNEFGGGSIPFRSMPGVAVGDLTWFTSGWDFEVRGFRGTKLTRVVRLLLPPRPVTDDDLGGYRTNIEERFAGAPNSTFESAYLQPLEHPSLPEFLPAFDDLLIDDVGQIWAARWSLEEGPEQVWEVFGADGVHLGHVMTPQQFTPFAIRDRTMIGLWTDELEVEYVRAIALRPPPRN